MCLFEKDRAARRNGVKEFGGGLERYSHDRRCDFGDGISCLLFPSPHCTPANMWPPGLMSAFFLTPPPVDSLPPADSLVISDATCRR